MNDERRARLNKWVKQQHSGQQIRETDQAYFSHVLSVAELSAKGGQLCYEIGLCHDLLEDTVVSKESLDIALQDCGYKKVVRKHIVNCVVDLTDEFTKERYPNLSKKKRKEMEAKRLLKIQPDAQTVKYADLIFNANWVLEHDKDGAKKYLNKKLWLLKELDKGDVALRKKAIKLLKNGLGK
ncbi:MAG: hypothetical protein V4687_16970 [Bacteroidota bacterium]